MIKKKKLDVCDDCCMFRHYYKSLKKESYEKSDNFIDDDDDAVDEDINYHSIITEVELEVKNTQYTESKRNVLS